MSKHIFKSRLGPHLETFIAQKQSVGFPYQSSARILYHFDDMVFEYFPDIESLTKEIVDKWIHYKPNEHPNGLLRRITPIRQFGKYLHAIGMQRTSSLGTSLINSSNMKLIFLLQKNYRPFFMQLIVVPFLLFPLHAVMLFLYYFACCIVVY